MSSWHNDGAGSRRRQTRVRRIPRILLILLPGLVCWTGLLEAAGPPRLTVPQDTIDIGDVIRGASVKIAFELRNDGESPLEIQRAKPSCSCTVASYDEVIAPGQVGKLEATLDTLKLWGETTRVIDLTTNQPGDPQRRLTIVARIIGSVEYLPFDHVALANRRPELRTSKILLRATADESGELELSRIESSEDWVEVSAERLTERRLATDGLPNGRPGDWVLTVSLTGQPPSGRSETTISMASGLRLEPRLTLPVEIDYRPPVRLSTKRVILRGPERAAEGEELTLSVERGFDPGALTVVTDPPGLTADLQPAGDREFTVRVRWTGQKQGFGKVAFQVGGESFELPVTLTAR